MYQWFWGFIGVCFLFFNFIVEAHPKNNGDESAQIIQKFYHNKTWNACLAAVSTGLEENRTLSDYSSCIGKLYMDSMCNGPNRTKKPFNNHIYITCKDAVCPCGYTCHDYYFGGVLCCENEQMYAVSAAYSEECPDGRRGGGFLDYGQFRAIFGEKCDDLICGEKEECVQINKFFVKCCGVTKPHKEVSKFCHRKRKPSQHP